MSKQRIPQAGNADSPGTAVPVVVIDDDFEEVKVEDVVFEMTVEEVQLEEDVDFELIVEEVKEVLFDDNEEYVKV